MPSKIEIEVDENILKRLVAEYLANKLQMDITKSDLKFEVQSNQNFRQKTWEDGKMRVVFKKYLT